MLRIDRPTVPWSRAGLLIALGLGCTTASLAERARAETIGPATAVDPPSIGPFAGNDVAPGIATAGSTSFVVWTNQGAALGVRLDSMGALLDPTPVNLFSGIPLAIATDGTAFVVISAGSGLEARRYDTGGNLLDAAPIAIAPSAVALDASVAFDGVNFVVVWTDYNSKNVFARRVSPLGALVDAAPIAVAASGANELHASVACAPGGECLVGWVSDYTSIRAARFQGGAVLDPAGIVVASGLSGVFVVSEGVTFDGTSFVATWNDWYLVDAARINLAGNVLDTTPISVAQVPGNLPQGPAIAGGPATSLVAYMRNVGNPDRSLFGRRVDASGMVLDPVDLPISIAINTQQTPALSSTASGWLAVWADARNDPASDTATDIYATRVATSGTVTDPNGILLSRGVNEEKQPSLASDGNGWLVAWSDTRGEAGDIEARRFDATGAPLNPTVLDVGALPRAQTHPSVAYSPAAGGRYLVGWVGQSLDASFSRVGTDGTVLDPGGVLLVPQNAQELRIACGTTDCLAVWTDGTFGSRDIHAARIDPVSGTVLDPTGFVVCASNYAQYEPSVTWDGTHYLVAWTDERSSTAAIYAARVDAATQQSIDGNGVLVSTNGPTITHNQPAIAWTGNQGLVTWTENGHIHAARVSAPVAPASPLVIQDTAASIVVASAAGTQTASSVTVSGDGHNAFVAWQDTRNATPDVYGAWVSEAGVVLQAGGIGVATSSSDETTPAVATRGGGHMLAVYGAKATGSVERLELRLVDGDALDGIGCGAPGDCASRECVDGFCCERACDGTCETCAAPGGEGQCHCTGEATCPATNPSCKIDLGTPCLMDQDCSTGFCPDEHVCCDAACNGGCASCDTAGHCGAVPSGTLSPACDPGYLCTGAQDCPTSCQGDAGCAPGFYCSATGHCAAFCNEDGDCPTDTHCDAPTGKCVSGATCDGHHTLTLASGDPKDCSPYACIAEGTCLTTCTSTVDCVTGFECDADGKCAEPPPPPPPAGDCSCRTTSDETPGGAILLAFAAAALARKRRRTR